MTIIVSYGIYLLLFHPLTEGWYKGSVCLQPEGVCIIYKCVLYTVSYGIYLLLFHPLTEGWYKGSVRLQPGSFI